jgi:lipid II:glycine glycyltransferase (peptidoglycan interpeptide bridge formation enzyme)
MESIIKLKDLLNEGEIKLIAAFDKEVMIGGMVLFDFMNNYMHAQYIASSHEHQHIRPVNAVIDYAIKWACENKYEYLNLGTPNEKNGNIINLGLSYFKEGFGGRSCLRETMHKLYHYEKK